MAKRFTDTQKYRKPFFRQLPSDYKLFWAFLYHECDHAGVWIVDFEIAQICLKTETNITSEKALEIFNKEEEKIIVIDNGRKWFLPGFIEFQYGVLNEKIKAHASAMKILRSNGVNPNTLKLSHLKMESNSKRIYDRSGKEKILFSEFPIDTLVPIHKLAEVYQQDKRLIAAVSKTTKKKAAQIKKLLPLFVDNLESQGKRAVKAQDFAVYFKNWLKYQNEPPLKQDKSSLDWSLLSTEEQYTLNYTEQVELIKQRMQS